MTTPHDSTRSRPGASTAEIAGPELPTEAGTAVVLAQIEREFAENVAHEFRSPLTAIATAVEALEAGALGDAESCAAFIRLIGRQAARMNKLTTSILSLGRVQALGERLRMTPVALLPILRDVAAASEADTVRIECAASLGAMTHLGLLEQIVSSLLANALRHGGSAEVTLRASLKGNDAMIEVIDHGSGIPTAHRSDIFERFSPVEDHSGGFGLGLSIVRDSVQAIGARLEIDSEEGRGTIARVVLPSVHLMNALASEPAVS